jgi:hypothetical protein
LGFCLKKKRKHKKICCKTAASLATLLCIFLGATLKETVAREAFIFSFRVICKKKKKNSLASRRHVDACKSY